MKKELCPAFWKKPLHVVIYPLEDLEQLTNYHFLNNKSKIKTTTPIDQEQKKKKIRTTIKDQEKKNRSRSDKFKIRNN